MRYYVYGYTDPGSGREKNEDAVLVNKEVINEGFREAVCDAGFITAVCDGVGGERAGEQASQMCLQLLSALDYTSASDLKNILMDIHEKIKKKSSGDPAATDMQTTLCALALDEKGRGLCVNVGDSRLYRYVNGTIRQISDDQSYGQFMYNMGEIDSADELTPEDRNAIVSAMGSPHSDPKIVQTPLVSEFGQEPDDMIIITSDGVSDYVTDNEFEVGLAMDLPISEKLVALAKLAILNGSQDNVSIIGIKPFIDFDELAALTRHDAVEQTVNVMEMLGGKDEEEKDELSDILTIDLEAIIGKKAPPPFPAPAPKPVEVYRVPVSVDETDPVDNTGESVSAATPAPDSVEADSDFVSSLDTDTEDSTGDGVSDVTASPGLEEIYSDFVSSLETDTEDITAESISDVTTSPGLEEIYSDFVSSLETDTEDITGESVSDVTTAPGLEEIYSDPVSVEDTDAEDSICESDTAATDASKPSEVYTAPVSREEIELEAHDLFMQAQASLSMLSGLMPKKKKSD